MEEKQLLKTIRGVLVVAADDVLLLSWILDLGVVVDDNFCFCVINF